MLHYKCFSPRFVISSSSLFGFPYMVKCVTNLCHGQRKSSLGPLTESGSDPMASLVPFGELAIHLYLVSFCCVRMQVVLWACFVGSGCKLCYI